MCVRARLLTVILTAAVLLLTATPGRSATPAEIENAINNGIAWLLGQQNPDGSWGLVWQVAETGLAVVKLQDRARELQTSEYNEEIQAGLDYIFSQAIDAGPYISWPDPVFGEGETYFTGIAMMAIANDGDLSQMVGVGPLSGLTYGDVLDGSVNYFLMSQNSNGGWGYVFGEDWADQSNTGYAVLGLSYAKDAGVTIPASIEIGLENWVNFIQCKTPGPNYGGSGYSDPDEDINLLKTGNLIFQMTFLGIAPADPRFTDAIAYIEAHWRDENLDTGWGYNMPLNNFQAMYCLMKGLQSSGVDEIDTDGLPGLEDWFNQEPPATPPQDFASHIVAKQNPDGSWTDHFWGMDADPEVIGTAWALLTLEKITVVHKRTVAVDIKPRSCPNPLNVTSQGLLPVAILGTEDIDVRDISWVMLDGVPPVKISYEDVATPVGEDADECECTVAGPDGYEDLVLHFDTQEVVAGLGDPSDGQVMLLVVQGELSDGTDIGGEDCVVIRNKKK